MAFEIRQVVSRIRSRKLKDETRHLSEKAWQAAIEAKKIPIWTEAQDETRTLSSDGSQSMDKLMGRLMKHLENPKTAMMTLHTIIENKVQISLLQDYDQKPCRETNRKWIIQR